jgi:hypothetical protein
VLRNPLAFLTFASFENEYALLPDAIAVRQVFRAEAVELERLEGTLYYKPGPNNFPTALFAALGMGPYSTSEYYGWRLTAQLGPKSLRDRATTENWLHGFFMKLCYPPPRSAEWQDPKLVAYPLNLTIFFRILASLHGNRYPAHWLADVLSDIVNNRVQSIARPPRSYPYAMEECRKESNKAWVNLAPFMAGMRTLIAIWLPDIPFGLMDTSKIPAISGIRRYSITFNTLDWKGLTNQSVFNVLLAERGLLSPVYSTRMHSSNVRTLLLTDEKRLKTTESDQFRKSCAIVSTWKWSTEGKRGTFWMDEDVMENWLKEDWQATILRQDNWVLCAQPVDIKRIIRKEDYWVERM